MDNKDEILNKPIEWVEPTTQMTFIWVPGGKFWMGQSEEETKMLMKTIKSDELKAIESKGARYHTPWNCTEIFDEHFRRELPPLCANVDETPTLW